MLLFQAGYSGESSAFGPSPVVPFTLPGPSLYDSEAGYVTQVPGDAGPAVTASSPGTLGTFFDGPWAGLPAGNFSVRLWLHASTTDLGPAPLPSESVLWIGMSAFAQNPYAAVSLTFGALATPGWVTETFNITVPEPSILFAVQGVTLATDVQLFVEALEVTPS